jgi:predicted ATP-grasp superfamily ATP-dependent carboligase
MLMMLTYSYITYFLENEVGVLNRSIVVSSVVIGLLIGSITYFAFNDTQVKQSAKVHSSAMKMTPDWLIHKELLEED